MIAMLAQWLLGVERQAIIDDCLVSAQRLPPLFWRRGEEDHGPLVEVFLGERGATLAGVCGQFLDGLGEFELDGTALRENFL